MAVLGSLLLSSRALVDVIPALRGDDFFRSAHQSVYESVVRLDAAGKDVDAITVSADLHERGVLDQVGGNAFVHGLSAAVTSTSNALGYAHVVAARSRERRLQTAGIAVQSLPGRGLAIDVQEAQALDILTRAIEHAGNDPLEDATAALDEVLAEIAEATETGARRMGQTTHFHELDNITGGLKGKQLWVFAGRPGMGKSALLFDIALARAQRQSYVAFWTLEMSKTELVKRALAHYSGIDLPTILGGVIGPPDQARYTAAVDQLRKIVPYLMIDDSGSKTPMEIKLAARTLHRRGQLDLICIDYLQLLSTDTQHSNRTQEVTEISRSLKVLASDLDVPVLTASQLSRAVESRMDKRPQLSDLRESGSIEQDCDVVVFLYRDDYYNPEDSDRPGICEVIVAKQRNGPRGTVELPFRARTASFTNAVDSYPPLVAHGEEMPF